MTDLRTTSLPPIESSLENGTIYNGSYFNRYNPVRNDNVLTALFSVTLIVCPLGLVGNGVVLWFLGFRVKRNPFTVYVLNLAAADFSFLLCLALILIVIILVLFYFLRYLELLLVFTLASSVSLLTAISAERCVSVVFPIWYRCHRPKHLSAILCALIWALSCLLTGLRAYVCFSDSKERCKVIFIQLANMNILIFTPITVLSSLILIIKVRRSSLQSQPRKLYIVILLNVFFFLLLFPSALSPSSLTLLTITILCFLVTCWPLSTAALTQLFTSSLGAIGIKKCRGSVKKALQRVFEEEANNREERVSAT